MLPNVRLAGEIETADAVPLRATVCVEGEASSVKVSVPESDPAVTGAKATATWQVPPGATVPEVVQVVPVESIT